MRSRLGLVTSITFCAVFVVSGCKQATVERNTVSGVVTLAGRPFEDGVVTLHGPGGVQAMGSILSGGRYIIDDPPLGLCQVTVSPPPGFATPTLDPNANAHSPPPEASSRIPKKYRTPGNGLSVDVKPGGTVFDIAMVN